MKKLLSSAIVLVLFHGMTHAQTVFVQEGDVWQFFRGTEEPPPDWAEPDFDAAGAGWESGPTGIGYGDDDDATVLDDMPGNYVSVFMRFEFDVPAGLEGSTAVLRVRYDDAFVAYIDEDEVARRNLFGTPPTFDELASDQHDISSIDGFDESIPIDGAELTEPGPHVLAIQVHNVGLDSTDLSFSAELVVAPFLVTSVAPPFGPPEGGGTVSILGSGFNPAEFPTVRFGAAESPDVVVVNAQELDVVVPPGDQPGPVDVTVEDSRGTVTLPNGYRYSGAGQVGLQFDGGQYASANSSGEISDEGSVEIWLRRTGGGGFFRSDTILAIEAPGGGDALRIDTGNNNRLRATGPVVEGNDSVQANPDLGDTWHHVAFTFSDGGRRLYLDGEIIAQDAAIMVLQPGARVRLGGSFSTGFFAAQPWIGEIESARLWAVELLPEEIRRDRFTVLDADDGLETAWPLDEGVGQTARDLGPFDIPLILGESTSPEGIDPVWIPLDDFAQFAVTSLEPNSGGIEGGYSVTIYGAGFSSENPPVVLFGGQASPDVTVIDFLQLEVIVPPGSVFGPVDVTVEAGAGSFTVPAGFTYEPDEIFSFIEEGDDWYYFVGSFAPPFDWAERGFDPDDNGWEEGPTGIGYGDDDDATVVGEMQGFYATLYARSEFQYNGDPDDVLYFRLRVRYDDGYVAYLNGQEVARDAMAGVPPTYDELSSELHEITGGAGTFDVDIDLLPHLDLLRTGNNVLAIEVHNNTLDSSDLSLSAEVVYAGSDPVTGPVFVRGDVNGDNNHTISDAILIIRTIFNGYQLACVEAADVDNNGNLNIADAIKILIYVFGSGEAPPPPFDEPGPDEDGDTLPCDETPGT